MNCQSADEKQCQTFGNRYYRGQTRALACKLQTLHEVYAKQILWCIAQTRSGCSDKYCSDKGQSRQTCDREALWMTLFF